MTRGDIRPGIADAKIADAGFASQRCHRREVCVQVRTMENADADMGSASR